MGRRFNGSGDHILLNIGTELDTLTAGPRTFAYLATVYDQTDGAVIHARIGTSTANADQCWGVEHAGNDWNYGQQVAYRRVGDAPIGNLCVFVVRKDAGGAAFPSGRVIDTVASTVTDVISGTTLADGPAPTSAGELRIGRWGGSGSEYLNADLHCVATWDRELSDAETLTLDPDAGSTWADWLALAPVGAWPLDQASATDPVPDDSDNGATSISITGTTIVADPPGFFGSAPAGVTPTGLAVPVALGAPTVALGLSATPTGLAVPVSLGSPTATLNRLAAPAGLAVPVALGSPTVSLNRTAAPDGLAVPVALGNPSASAGAGPAGLAVAVSLGAPTVTRPSVSPTGLPVPIVLGAPAGALGRTAAPAGLAIPVNLGAPQVGDQAPYETAVLTPGALAAAVLTPSAAAGATLIASAAAAATLTPSSL